MAKKFEKLLERATDSTLLDPHWENVLLCVDGVKSGEVQPKQALTLIRKRYRNENPHVRQHTLLVLEALVKNCGEKIHREVATKEFMEDLKHFAEENTVEKVKEKVLELIQCWSHAFRNKPEYKIVVDTHNLMKLEGYAFPPLRETDAMFDAESAPEWLDSPNCHRCKVEFGLLTRKHHCRNCGQVFCDKCSSRTLPLPHIGIETDVRVCETCFDVIRSKTAGSSAKPTLSKISSNRSSIDSDTKGPSISPKEKTSDENEKMREEEDMQLALAISQSEAEETERQKQRQLFGYNGFFSSNHINKAEEVKDQRSTGYTGTQDMPQATNNGENNDSDGELAKYLNRGYWEARRSDQKRGILRNSPTPSAPVAPPSDNNVSEVILNGKGQDVNFNGNGESENFPPESTSPELNNFVEKLRSGIEVFVNRIRNDVIRGRSIVTDSSVQAMFLNLTAMHAQLLQHMTSLDDRRGYFESLQDKLAQIKDAREAVDALREEHVQRRQSEFLEMQRQRQIQMAAKLDVMRQKKHEMLEHQRLLAMQRIDEQRREMETRRQMQMQHQQQMAAGVVPPQPYSMQDGAFANMYQMGVTLPNTTGQQAPVVSYPQQVAYVQQPATNSNGPFINQPIYEVPNSSGVYGQPMPTQVTPQSPYHPISHNVNPNVQEYNNTNAQNFSSSQIPPYAQHASFPYSNSQPAISTSGPFIPGHPQNQAGYYQQQQPIYSQLGAPVSTTVPGSAAYSNQAYGGQPISAAPVYYYPPHEAPGATNPIPTYSYPPAQHGAVAQPGQEGQNQQTEAQLISFD